MSALCHDAVALALSCRMSTYLLCVVVHTFVWFVFQDGTIVAQHAATANRFQYGQCDVPGGVSEWMNAAVFGTSGRWETETNSLEVKHIHSCMLGDANN